MVTNDLKKKQMILIAAAIVFAGIFGYGFYTAMGAVSSSKADYIAKYAELTSLEEKQRQTKSIEEELAENKEAISAIKKAFIEQTYENKLALVIDLENIAKSAELVYELSIAQEMTAESIAEEKALQARARRKSQQIREEAVGEQLPSIVFSIKLAGPYPAVVNFIERLQVLPYYTDIDNFNIASKRVGEEGGGEVEASVQFTVFTR